LPCARNKHTAKTTFCYVSFVAHGKEYILPCVFFFAVCCRSWHTANILHCRVSTALPCVFFMAHGKQDLCRVPLSLSCVPFVAHGKYALCCAPEIVHTAKILAHGKLRVSGSDPFLRKNIGLPTHNVNILSYGKI